MADEEVRDRFGTSRHASIDTRLPARNITRHEHDAEAILPAPHRVKKALSSQAPGDSAISDRGRGGGISVSSRTTVWNKER
jgi:hypothetical protein